MVVHNEKVLCPECKQENNKDICYCNKCDECFSTNLYFHDDGDGYVDIECLDCGNFSQ